jgi:hypothetical protein
MVGLVIPMHRSQDWNPPCRYTWRRGALRPSWRLSFVVGAASLLCLGMASAARAQDPVPDQIGTPRSLRPDEVKSGWLSLFDGESLFGWQNASTADWSVAEGCLTATQGDSPGLLTTTTQFDCYELRVDFWASSKTNSGVFLRTSPEPQSPRQDCIELNIAPKTMSPFPTG